MLPCMTYVQPEEVCNPFKMDEFYSDDIIPEASQLNGISATLSNAPSVIPPPVAP